MRVILYIYIRNLYKEFEHWVHEMKNYVQNKIVYTRYIKYSHYFQILMISISATDHRHVTARGTTWAVLSLFDIHWSRRRIQRNIIIIIIINANIAHIWHYWTILLLTMNYVCFLRYYIILRNNPRISLEIYSYSSPILLRVFLQYIILIYTWIIIILSYHKFVYSTCAYCVYYYIHKDMK